MLSGDALLLPTYVLVLAALNGVTCGALKSRTLEVYSVDLLSGCAPERVSCALYVPIFLAGVLFFASAACDLKVVLTR